jgi:type IV pilus assembly protein PilM
VALWALRFSFSMIGVDISDRSVKVVHLANSDHQLLGATRQVLPEGAMSKGIIQQLSVVQKTFAVALQECHLKKGFSDAVVASIPETQSFLRVVEIPIMAEDEVTEAIPWEVAQHIPFGLENVYIDWQPLQSGHQASAGRREVLVGAAQKKVIDPLLTLLQSFDLDIAALELESQAIVRALISNELKSQQGLLIIDLGGSATNVVIHDHGALRFTASLLKGANDVRSVLSPQEADIVKNRVGELAPADIERISALLKPREQELAMEVKGITEFYNSIDEQHEVKDIVLTGGGSNLPGLEQVFLQYFENVQIQRGNPWVNVLSRKKELKAPLDPINSARFTTALGLALRPVTLYL